MVSLIVGLLMGRTSTHQKSQTTLPFLIGAEWNPDASQAVKDLFLETGCNFVRLTGGGYGWAAPKHVASLKFLEAHGIKALVQLGSHWPDGKYLDHASDYFVDDQGVSGKHEGSGVSYSGQSWPQMTYASDGYRKGLEADFSSYLDQVKPFDNVAALLLHNEPGYFWVDDRIFDYNPQAIAKFRVWLPSQHASIAELNQCWGSSFASFSQVDPPRERPPVSHIAAWMDWRRFNSWLIQDFLKWESGFAKRQMPSVTNMTNLSGPLDNWYPLRLGDNYKYASASDAACIDIYSTEWSNRFFTGLAMDMSRGVAKGRPVVVAECESYDSPNFPKLSEPERGQRLECDLWTYIGHGARGICIWTLNGESGFVLTHGEFNPRMAALRETAHLAGMIGLDDFTRPKAPVALCVDQDAFLYFGGMNPNRDGAQFVQRSMTGLYAALVQSGHDVDIICSDDVRAGRASNYKAVVMATPAITDDVLAKQLASYVKDGGCLIAETPFAQWDRWGRKTDWSALGLDRLFGASIKPSTTNLVGGAKFDWSSPVSIELLGAKTLEGSGLKATVHTFGRGEAILFNENVGLTNGDGENTGAATSLGAVVSRYATTAPRAVSVDGPGYIDSTYLQDGKGNTLVVLTNPSDKKEAIVPKRGVRLTLQPSIIPPGAQVFRLGTFSQPDGSIQAGAIRETDGITLPELDASAAFLIGSNHSPVLSLTTPTTAKARQPFMVQMKVWNPSPNAVDLTASLKTPSGWTGEQKTLRLPPRESGTVTLKVTPGAPSPRSVVVPVLKLATGKVIEGVPMDVSVSG